VRYSRQKVTGYGIDALIKEAKDADADSLPAEIDALTQRIQALERNKSELDQLIGSERAILDSMDGRAEALSKKTQIIFFPHHLHILELAKMKLSKEGLITHYLDS
jgi:hypothetical protein